MKSEVTTTLRCRLCSTRYTSVLDSKSISAIKIEGKPSHATIKLTLFAVNKDEWNTKEDTGKSMKNALCVLHYAYCSMPKGTSQAEAMSNSEKSNYLIAVR